MKNTLSQFQLARVALEDIAGFLSTGTTATRHAELALFIAANQATADKQLSEFLIGDETEIAEAVGHAWHVIASGFGLVLGAAVVQAASIVLEEWTKRERAVPSRLHSAQLWSMASHAGESAQTLENRAKNGGPEGSGLLS